MAEGGRPPLCYFFLCVKKRDEFWANFSDMVFVNKMTSLTPLISGDEEWRKRWEQKGRGGKIWEGKNARGVNHMGMQMINAGISQWADVTKGGNWMGWKDAKTKYGIGVQCKTEYGEMMEGIVGEAEAEKSGEKDGRKWRRRRWNATEK